MTERDRLAADLADALNCGGCEKDEPLADRLIALGWTRLDGDSIHKLPVDLDPPLDVYRLARAADRAGVSLLRLDHDDIRIWHYDGNEAAAIAAAYEADR